MTTSGTAAAPRAAVQQDALGQFVATAAPGQERSVTLPDGRPARVQVLRAYAAASGRECREVLLGGATGRASLLCESEGQWVASRPLLGGGAVRP